MDATEVLDGVAYELIGSAYIHYQNAGKGEQSEHMRRTEYIHAHLVTSGPFPCQLIEIKDQDQL